MIYRILGVLALGSLIFAGCSLGSLDLSSTRHIIVHPDSIELEGDLNQNDYKNSIYLYNKVKENHATHR